VGGGHFAQDFELVADEVRVFVEVDDHIVVSRLPFSGQLDAEAVSA